ncbi:polysaccharide deacetylase [Desulfocucumis palustris]|uniref:Polysaccharide deacetylase n=1 Tax=Desulfocucumis palustris TaxID=1898651 RepID=A0A2L2XIJ2_9FIRM|nr:polysaccharide deacetylase family protein [Desulfocucumis palustris]GBF35523.1 polysaccharide deacetylase [Desulfocucumis palustris]
MAKKIIALLVITALSVYVFFYAVGCARDDLAESLADYAYTGDISREVPVLMYHKVNPDPFVGGYGLRVTPRSFDRQLRFLKKKGFHSISLVDLAEYFKRGRPLPKKPVVITFDDGYLDNYTYAFPILKKYGMTATVFVVADTIGGINDFDYRAGRQPLNHMAGWKELREMSSGGITIGSHTLSHPHLAEVDPDRARKEIARSKIKLEKGLGKKVDVFCYPYGNYNQRVVDMVRESGYLAAVTTKQGLARESDGIYTLRRIRVRGDYTQGRFIYELSKWQRTGKPSKAI